MKNLILFLAFLAIGSNALAAIPPIPPIPPPATLSSQSGGSDYSPTMLPHWRACLAALRNGTKNCRMVMLGDSTTYGYGATAGAGTGPQLNEGDFISLYLNQRGIPANNNSFCGNGALVSPGPYRTVSGADSRIAAGSNWANSTALQALGGYAIVSSAANSTALVYTPITSYNSASAAIYPAMQPNTFNVTYYTVSGRGTLTLTATGGSTTTITGTGAGTFVTAVAATATASATNALTIQSTTSTGLALANFNCIEAYNSAVYSVNIINAGIPSALSGSFTGTNVNGLLDYLAPALVVYKPGINDWNTGVALSTFLGNVQSVITNAQTSGIDLIIESPNPTSTQIPLQTTYVAALQQIAANNNIPFVNNWANFVSYANSNALGFNFNTLHPNSPGYADLAISTARVMALGQ